jgi:secreted trypsin-like serine protease
MYLAGIVSFGSSTCAGSIPGVYTKVETFIGWIKEKMMP